VGWQDIAVAVIVGLAVLSIGWRVWPRDRRPRPEALEKPDVPASRLTQKRDRE
jgi:hypothetical protein